MSPEDDLRDPLRDLSSIGEDVPLSCGDLVSSRELGRRSGARGGLHTGTPVHRRGDFARGQSPYLKTLMDAEAAANSAAIQLVSFKDAMEDEFADPRRGAIDKRRIARQRGLLLEKLEDFRQINKSVRQKLKQLQDAEANRIESDRQTDLLLEKISQAESENEQLKRDLRETERKAEELTALRREEQENVKSALHTTKSVEAARARLQGQLRIKESENNRLTVQLRVAERTLTKQKMEIDDLKGSIASSAEKAAQDKESLKKATRAQKQRAERFEAAVEKCYAQIKEKDAQLAEARSERDSRRQEAELETAEKDRLVGHVERLEARVADAAARLREETGELTAANETATRRVERLAGEKAELDAQNATLEASVSRLQQRLAGCESALAEATCTSEERKHQLEQGQLQVEELQAEFHDLRLKHANLLKETERTRAGKDADVEKVRQELQGRVDELESHPESLSASERSLFECRENLRRSERKCSEKSASVRRLQVQMEGQADVLTSSVEMRESVRGANLQLGEKVASLQKSVDALQQENLEQVRRLAGQEEDLSCSNRQLDQRSAECRALSRQLEAALADVKQQVNKVKDKAASREEVLQTRILELGAEKSRRDNELRVLQRSKLTAEKQFGVRLKELQLSLDQSESHKRSIQNYVDFLKNSYETMFDEGPQASGLGSSYFLK
ncbi:outer dense fiber protein 2-like isoform X2 [Cyclopterus lumpus]|uniref:outer dense fiber protein 2-like isoform X2 n=1 Tax=Cyclopterus lumpus TaxID=8103 RepID=UPI001486FA67|nr:outer dense fiber protein 2-like isoform X2 [Cyclopterus lumpus]